MATVCSPKDIAKSLKRRTTETEFPERPNRELSRGVGKWRILGFGGSKNPLLYPAPYQNCIPTGKKRAPAQGPGLLLARHHRGSVGTGAAISTQLFLPLSVLPRRAGDTLASGEQDCPRGCPPSRFPVRGLPPRHAAPTSPRAWPRPTDRFRSVAPQVRCRRREQSSPWSWLFL